jgi:hypothetical protein
MWLAATAGSTASKHEIVLRDFALRDQNGVSGVA